MHPELIYAAASKARINASQVIYDAFCYSEIRIKERNFRQVLNAFRSRGEIPEHVEDYALLLLAGETNITINLNP